MLRLLAIARDRTVYRSKASQLGASRLRSNVAYQTYEPTGHSFLLLLYIGVFLIPSMLYLSVVVCHLLTCG